MIETFVTGIDGSLGSAIAAKLDAIGSPRGTTGRGEIFRLVKSIPQEQFDALRCLVINDGTNGLSWIGATPEDAGRIVELNVMSAYWFLDSFVALRRDSPMRVLFIASQTYRVAQRTTALYCASKAAVVQMMRAAARELAPRGWIVNALAPGKIEFTEMSRRTDGQVNELRGWTPEEAEEYALRGVPAGRFTTPAEVASAVEWALAAPDYVNGAVLEVMGGV